MAILDDIALGKKLNQLNIKELKALSKEIRDEILLTTSNNGGHLSSNLGVVEATLAIHHVFDLPTDKLIFDVGHQCYAHKILINGKKEFSTIRTRGGLSGFQCGEEGEYDLFSAGHAGNSLSLALGVCKARDIKGEDYSVITVTGDGSFVNGLNLEALTVSKQKPKNLIVILNDNEMSISKNQNGLYELLSRRTSGGGYVKSKRAVKKVFGNSFVTKFFSKCKRFMKRLTGRNLFIDDSGFKYVGIVDGNDVKAMIKYLRRVKNIAKDKAVFLHIKTTKGKGYDKAEERADAYHGVGKDLKSSTGDFSATLGEKICSVMEKDKDVVAITAGMKDGTGLKIVEEKFPDRFYDVGIAEEYAVSFSAGLARGGLKPVVAIYSTFMQRAYDQILHDVCLQNVPVTFCLDRAGLVGADGKTHQGVFDLSYLGHLPNMQIFAPATKKELEGAIDFALNQNSPVAIRYPNAKEAEIDFCGEITSWQTVKDGKDITILAVGPRTISIALEVAKEIPSVRVINARAIKPLDKKILDEIANDDIITIEENALIGGFGGQVCSYYAEKNLQVKLKNFAVCDEFICHATVEEQLKYCKITKEEIIKHVKDSGIGEKDE